MQYANQVLSTQAMTLGVSDTFYMLGVIFFCLVPCVWLAKPPFASRGAGAAH